MYKISLLLFCLLFLFIETTSAQLRLEVEGDAKILGGLDVRSAGTANIFIGHEAGLANQNTSYNTFVGRFAGKDNTTGSFNTFLGGNAGANNTTGSQNTFLGRLAGTSNTIGENNTFIGSGVGLLNTEGSYNVFIGEGAGTFNKTGEQNTFVGEEAGYANTTGSSNTFIGKDAGNSNTFGFSNTFLGRRAGQDNVEGYDNTFVGQSAGGNNLAHSNTFMGSNAGFFNTSGERNVFLGTRTGQSNSTGHSNTFVGEEAGLSNGGGVRNTFIGEDTGRNNYSSDGSNGTFVGSKAGMSNSTGVNNTFIGEEAGYNNTSGFENTFVGQEAGNNNITGSNLVAIGKGAGASNSFTENAFLIGNRGLISRDHSGTLGNLSMQRIGGYVNWSSASDGRMKNKVKEDVEGLAFILQLRPVSYQLDALKLDGFLRQGMDKLSNEAIERSEEELAAIEEARQTYEKYLKEKSAIRYTGFIAQEVEEAMQQADFEFSGLVKPAHEQDHYSLRYAEFVVPLVKGMQEQQAVIEEQANEIKSQEARIRSQEARLAQIEVLLQQSAINNGKIPHSTTDQQLATDGLPRLYPNQPNPFSDQTLIRYCIPVGSTKGEIRIANLEGKVIKVIPIQATGEGQLTVNAQSLSAGTYLYSLIVDGELIATEKMVLTHTK